MKKTKLHFDTVIKYVELIELIQAAEKIRIDVSPKQYLISKSTVKPPWKLIALFYIIFPVQPFPPKANIHKRFKGHPAANGGRNKEITTPGEYPIPGCGGLKRAAGKIRIDVLRKQ